MDLNALKSVVICGPTASGKTALAIELARHINGEIVNADSMQVYRGMDIGSAKPTAQEREQTPFHLINVADPDCQFTASDWKQHALAAITDIRSRGRVPILCGGAGMYLRALLRNWSLADTPRDEEIRKALEAEALELGSAALHQRLEKLDTETAKRLHPNDALRIVRALEVITVSGTPLSTLHEKDRKSRSEVLDVEAKQFGLTMPRDRLYRRIDERVDDMMAGGLETEVRKLLNKGFTDNLPAMNSLGYKEMCACLRGDITREAAIEQIKLSTRRYAKRQLTWFRAEPGITWIDTSIVNSAEAVTGIVSALQAGTMQIVTEPLHTGATQ